MRESFKSGAVPGIGVGKWLFLFLFLLSAECRAQELSAGCFTGSITKGLDRGTTVRLLIEEQNLRRYNIHSDSGGPLFRKGRNCTRRRSTKTTYVVVRTPGTKEYRGSEGSPCDFPRVGSNITLTKLNTKNPTISFKRDVLFLAGVGGKGDNRRSTATLYENRSGCNDLGR